MNLRIIAAGAAAALVTTALLAVSPAEAVVPSAPASCSATLITDTADDYRIQWTEPASPNGVVWRYALNVKGVSGTVQLSAPNRQTAYTGRSYDWTAPIPTEATSPLTFRVRAVNDSGFSAWCEAPAISAPTSTATSVPTTVTTSTMPTSPTSSTTFTPPVEPVTNPALPCASDSWFKDSALDNAINASWTSSFRSFMSGSLAQSLGQTVDYPKVNVNASWSGINHISQSGDPIWKITGGQSDSRLNVLRTQGFHLADSVLRLNPDGTQDRLLVIYDPIFGYVAMMADTLPNFSTRTISVSSAGIMWYDSNCLDSRAPGGDPRNFTSRGRIAPSMQAPAAWLQWAIDHGTGLGYPLQTFFVKTDASWVPDYVFPMVGSEGKQVGGWGPEGVRLRLDPSLDVASLGLTPGCLAIARTLQESGTYIGDNSGAASTLKIGHPGQYPAAMGLGTDCFKGKISWQQFSVVSPW